jgi:putative oxidoreductase
MREVKMNILLWVLQILFGVYFIAVGVMHFVLPPGLPSQMAWMYELSTPLHTISGAAEILGGLGLILPAVTRIQPRLVVWAAAGLALVMLAATIWHIPRGEYTNMVLTLVNAGVMIFISYGRARLAPLSERRAANP